MRKRKVFAHITRTRKSQFVSFGNHNEFEGSKRKTQVGIKKGNLIENMIYKKLNDPKPNIMNFTLHRELDDHGLLKNTQYLAHFPERRKHRAQKIIYRTPVKRRKPKPKQK